MEVDEKRAICLLKNVHAVLPQNAACSSYNLFSVLDVEEKEVIMCRMLADLLNPYGQHKCGSIFLRSFMDDVLHVDNSVIDNIDKLQVTKEYPIENRGSGPCESDANESKLTKEKQPKRIDIVIHGAGHFIPIEVKIDASETGTQCWEYYQYASKIDHQTNLYFLTKYGTYPDNSYDIFINKNCTDKFKRISFAKDIKIWLETIAKYDFDDEGNIIHNVIRQYLMSVCFFTNLRRMDMTELCAKEVMKTDIEAGIAIAKSVTAIQDSLITKLFTAVEDVFPKDLAVVLDDSIENNWKKIGKDFFGSIFVEGQKYASKKPCVGFKIKNTKSPEDIFLYVHIDWRIWAEIRSGNDTSWIYLPTGNTTAPKDDEKSDVPNFYTMNPAAVKLNSNEEMDKFISHSVDVIKNKLMQ